MPAQRQGEGIYFDGVTGVRQAVTLRLDDDAIVIMAPEGRALARWNYAALEPLPTTAERLRLALDDSPSTARLEVRDPEFAEAVRHHSGFGTPHHQASERRRRRLVVAWSAAAVAAIMTVAVVGLPAFAELLVPLVPPTREVPIGAVIHQSALKSYRVKGPVECGDASPREKAGKAAFLKLFRHIELAADLTIPVRAYVIRSDIVNASAIPGGILHFHMGLIRFAESPEELASVMGHELGHLVHRHGLRGILHKLGLGYVLAMVTGDFFTGSGVILATYTVLDRRNTREQERQADAYGQQLMARLGADNHAAEPLWDRMVRRAAELQKKKAPPRTLLSYSHPDGAERAATIRAAPRVANPTPLLTAAEWQALRQVCSGG